MSRKHEGLVRSVHIVAEIITQASGRPTSIGISGSWGAGKSTMIKLVRAVLAKKDEGDASRFIAVEFNTWLYLSTPKAAAAKAIEGRTQHWTPLIATAPTALPEVGSAV